MRDKRHHRALFRAGRRRGRRHAPGRALGLQATSSPSTWAAPRPTSAWCRTAGPRSPRKARSTACRSARPCSTSSRSAPAAARSSGSTTAACCASARKAPAPIRARPATARAAPSPPRPTPISSSAPSGPSAFLGGRMRLDGDAARRAFEPLAAALRPQRRAGRRRRRCSSPTPTSCAPSSSSRPSAAAIRATTRWCRSAAPGPLHAARIAEELGISTIVVPPNAGVISAYGLVASDYTKFDAVTRKMKLDEAAAKEAGQHLRRDARAARRAVRRHEAAGRPRLHPHARHALRRPGLRGRRRDSRPTGWPRSTRPISPSCSPTPITAPSCTAPRSTGRSRS